MKTVQTFSEISKSGASAGGKGSALARLSTAGYPVPEGFVILPTAFKSGMLENDSWDIAKGYIKSLKEQTKSDSFAVRSSALSEDSLEASFAGEFETILNVSSENDIFEAIHKVYNSHVSIRVQSYSKAKGIEDSHEIAVVIQKMIQSEISGVLFTVDPVKIDYTVMSGNFIYGLGEGLVSGEITPFPFTFRRNDGKYLGSQELKKYSGKLYKIAKNIEKDMGCPQDIEWAIAEGKIYILQSRPITTLKNNDKYEDECNDSLKGDYLWSNSNFAEAVPDVMTPMTWSVLKTLMLYTEPFKVPGNHPFVGNICGRPYVNISVNASLMNASGTNLRDSLKKWENVFGFIPTDINVPLIKFNFVDILSVIPGNIKWNLKAQKIFKKFPEFVVSNPSWCKNMRNKLDDINDAESLIDAWNTELEPYFFGSCIKLRAAMKIFQDSAFKLRRDLIRLVGEKDTNQLMSYLRGNSGLASLGPMTSLYKVAAGLITKDEYVESYGYRGPHESELSIPSPDENSGFIDSLLKELTKSDIDVNKLFDNQQIEYKKALERLQIQYPQQYKKIVNNLEKVSFNAGMREAIRSEYTRVYRVIRKYAVVAGKLTGLGDDVFFLKMSELQKFLKGDYQAADFIEKRKKDYQMYCSFPQYPTLIIGHFYPFKWAKDQNKRSDLYDFHAQKEVKVSSESLIKGFAGAAGIVEGTVRKIDKIEDGYLLKEGEILVTSTTNIGWTPLFPIAAAIVTDIGAPLSHAAIVARELGIPAVVGCGNATMFLETGDRVIVDGGSGVVRKVT